MVYFGSKHVLGKGLIQEKEPKIDYNSDFNFGVFHKKFDYFLARSIWTHASRKQIETMLDQFIKWSKPTSVFLASYVPADDQDSYLDEEWVGKSHKSEVPGLIHHSFEWIQEICENRNLFVEEVHLESFEYLEVIVKTSIRQIWLKIVNIT